MITKKAIKKIMISTLALVLVSTIYMFPNNKNNSIKVENTIKSVYKKVLYIPNTDNYVSRVMIINNDQRTIFKIKEIIDNLTINSQTKNYIPYSFTQIIPEKTKIINLELKDGLLKINFSKELLNIDINHENQMIESLVYSLTELKEVNSIIIFVESNLLTELPNSKTKLPSTLTRKIGINKKYNISDYKDTKSITTYYLGKQNNIYYYIPITTVSNFSEEKISVIIKELKTAPIYQTNLISFLRANVEMEEYEMLDNKIKLSFNNYIFEDITKKNILEEVKYCISLSIRDTYDINTIIFNVNNDYIEEFKI